MSKTVHLKLHSESWLLGFTSPGLTYLLSVHKFLLYTILSASKLRPYQNKQYLPFTNHIHIQKNIQDTNGQICKCGTLFIIQLTQSCYRPTICLHVLPVLAYCGHHRVHTPFTFSLLYLSTLASV